MDGDSALRWYTAVFVVRARIEGAWHDDCLIDHQVRLIRARDPESAYAHAIDLGKAEAQSYRNSEGALVIWEFDGLADLSEVQFEELGDGVEVHSWRSRGQAGESVLPKEKLAVFWLAANAHRRVEELRD